MRTVDDHLVIFVDDGAAKGPNEPVRPTAVAGSIAQRHAARGALGLEGLEHFQKTIGVFWKAVDTCCLEVALAVDHDGAAGSQRYAYPFFAIGLEVGLASGVPAAVFFAQVVAHV